MSKKSKRQVRKVTPQALEEAAIITNINAPKQPSFNPDYSYVLKDLRRVGVLVGSFVIVLIALTFFLR
jgi:hypothetical protein